MTGKGNPIERTKQQLETWCFWCENQIKPLVDGPCLKCMYGQMYPIFWEEDNDCMWTAYKLGWYMHKPEYYEEWDEFLP